MKKYITETSNAFELVDKQTGELLKYKQVRKVSIDEFIMVFFTSYPELMKLTGVQLKVLMCCWKLSSFNPLKESTGNVINNNTAFKEYCKEEGVSAPSAGIDNAISMLCKKRLILKRCKGEYILNPEYFFKGTLSNRSKIDLRFIVEPTKK
jgi:hypothetical protein